MLARGLATGPGRGGESRARAIAEGGARPVRRSRAPRGRLGSAARARSPLVFRLPSPPPRSIWRDGSARPEPALDQFTLVSKYEALGTLVAGGLGFFATIGLITKFVSDDRPVVFKPRTVAVPPEVSQTFA